jgi:hypothetical protein
LVREVELNLSSKTENGILTCFEEYLTFIRFMKLTFLKGNCSSDFVDTRVCQIVGGISIFIDLEHRKIG